MKNLKIKLIGILAVVAIILTTPVYSQNNSRFGVKGGINFSNMYTNNVNERSIIVGVNAGLFFKMALTDYLAFQPELLYTMKGAKLRYQSPDVTGTAKFTLNYIEVPLLVVINLSKTLNLQAGVYAAALTNVSISNDSDTNVFNFEKEMNRDNFETLDYGLVVGLGGDFNKISMGIRYEYGLQIIGKDRTFEGQVSRFPDARNSTLQVYIGISIL